MHIAQVVGVELTGGASSDLSYDAYIAAKEWLTKWTPQANFKAVVGTDLNNCVDILREDLRENLVPSHMARYKVSPKHFKFRVAHQAVEGGRFWLPGGSMPHTYYYIGEK